MGAIARIVPDLELESRPRRGPSIAQWLARVAALVDRETLEAWRRHWVLQGCHEAVAELDRHIAAAARWDELHAWAARACVVGTLSRHIAELDRRIAAAARWDAINAIIRAAPKVNYG